MKVFIAGVGCYASALTFLSVLGFVLFFGGDHSAISMGIWAGLSAVMVWPMVALMISENRGRW